MMDKLELLKTLAALDEEEYFEMDYFEEVEVDRKYKKLAMALLKENENN